MNERDEFDVDQEDLFNTLLLLGENNGDAYAIKSAEAALDAAFKYNLEVIIGNLNFDYTVIKPLLLRTLQAKWSNAEEETVLCKFCSASISSTNAHIHQSSYVCENCWDDRLKATE